MKLLVIPSVLALVLSARGSAQQPARDAAATRRAMSAALDSVAAQGFAGHVLAIRNGTPFFEQSRGISDPATKTPVDSTTIFSIGSVTKRFTHAAVLKLEEQGKLSLGDPISRFIPSLPADKQRITIDQVVGMRAGFREYHDTEGDTTPGDHQRVSKDEALRRIAAQTLLFEPGTRREYSNSGYTILAAIIEKASGMDFERYIRTTFVDPLGMTSTGFYGESRWPDARMARGLGRASFGTANAPNHWPRASWVLMGAGGMVSNARDLARFIGAVRSGKVFGTAAVAKFYPREPAVYAGGNDFGFGTLVIEMDGGRDVVIVNTHSGDGRMAVGVQLAEIMRGAPLPDELRAMFRRQDVQASGPPQQQMRPLPDTPQARTIRAFLGALRDGTPAAIEKAVNELFTAEMRGMAPMPQHLQLLGDVGRAMKEANIVVVAPTGDNTFELRIGEQGNGTLVKIEVESGAPYHISGVGIERR